MSLPEQSHPPTAAAGRNEDWRRDIVERTRDGARFGGVYGRDRGRDTELICLLTTPDDVIDVRTTLTGGTGDPPRYPSLSPDVPAAFWYERALHDLSGVVPVGHPRLDPLLLPVPSGEEPPRPGRSGPTAQVRADDAAGPADVHGRVFTLPLGPVRSGVMESIELLLETPGEDIPHLNIRPHYKHRGVAKQFENRTVERGVLVAERVEGVSTVAHALAFCHAVERIADAQVPRRARLLRVVHAELERIANHLDVTMRLCDAAGLAVATARFGWHKETVQRLVSGMCGSRFARGVVVPGGVSRLPALEPAEVERAVARLDRLVTADISALEGSASFLDRLRGTGPLGADRAREHGALGPIGRASGYDDDDRRARPYDAYAELPEPAAPPHVAGDALARTRVRWHEIGSSVRLIHAALADIVDVDTPLHAPVHVGTGFAVGWAEAAQGEALHGLELEDGVIRRCFARSASLHNLLLLHDVFAGDIFTDLPFIEASFGLSYAGVAM